MDPSQTIKLVVLVILLLLSAFFSSAETALTGVSKIKLMSLAQSGNKRANLTIKVKENASKMLSAILIGNNIVNLSASALTTTLAIETLGNTFVGLFTGILTFIILIFGEIIPKTLATYHAERLSLMFAPVINLLMYLLTPIIYIINLISNGFISILGIKNTAHENTYTEDEIRTIVSVSHKEGVIESDEKQIINNLFDFGDALAKDVMIPRIDMTSISIDSTYYEIISVFKQEKFTRLPVYDGSTDNVIGIINVKDLLLYEPETPFNVNDILREPYYTYEYKNVSELMNELKKNATNIVIVLDEYGSTVGMITLEDLLEEIVGEIKDEYDEDEEEFKKIDVNTYCIDGSTRLDDINERFYTDFSSDEYESIAGFIIETLDRLPKAGDSIETEFGTLTVKSLDKNRIETVEFKINPRKNYENGDFKHENIQGI